MHFVLVTKSVQYDVKAEKERQRPCTCFGLMAGVALEIVFGFLSRWFKIWTLSIFSSLSVTRFRTLDLYPPASRAGQGEIIFYGSVLNNYSQLVDAPFETSWVSNLTQETTSSISAITGIQEMFLSMFRVNVSVIRDTFWFNTSNFNSLDTVSWPV